MLGLDDDDLVLAEQEELAAPLAQTPSLGLKQSAVRWLPGAASADGAIAAAGSWDEYENGGEDQVALWSVRFEPGAEDAMEAAEAEAVRIVCSSPHSGCVLGLAVAATAAGAAVFTASGAGGAACYSVEGGGAALSARWSEGTDAHAGVAALGVCWNEHLGRLALVSEDGRLALIEAERAKRSLCVQSDEPSLGAVCWPSAHVAATAASCVLLWDVRQPAPAPSLRLACADGVPAHLAPQLHAVGVHSQRADMFAAGSSGGEVYVWDARAPTAPVSAPSAATRIDAHRSDVWEVRFAPSAYGDLLSCSSDGTLQAWTLSALGFDEASRTASREAAARLGFGAEEPLEPASRTLVEFERPVNSFDVSDAHGALAAASDAEVLTFLDLRH